MKHRLAAFFHDCTGSSQVERGIHLACLGVWLFIGLESLGAISVRG